VDIVVMADTHLRGDLRLPGQLRDAVERADLVLHAGDVTSEATLRQLGSLVETHAVLGNNDHELVGALPAFQLIVLDGVRVALMHDGGPTRGRAARLHRRFPDADVVVFGHSHIPVDEQGLGSQLLFNPGSPTLRRSHPWRTFGRLRIEDHQLRSHTIEILHG
jgi:putative phosphoesterase